MATRFSSQHSPASLACAASLAVSLFATPFGSLEAQTPAASKATGKGWVLPRTADGKPDLQGNWSNETQTPLERMGKQGPTLTEEQAAALEKRAQDVEEFRDRPTDPNEGAPSVGGNDRLSPPGQKTFVEQIAEAAGGAVGGYNGFWLDPGNKVIRINGEPRASFITFPKNGRIPAMSSGEAGSTGGAGSRPLDRRMRQSGWPSSLAPWQALRHHSRRPRTSPRGRAT